MVNIFKELRQQYTETDDFFGAEEFNARVRGYNRKEESWRRKRFLNDHAYFLFLFTRIEGHIRNVSSKLIIDKQETLTNWSVKRAWEIFPKEKDSQRLTFMERVALITFKGRRDFNLVKRYYDLRNTIAHGGSFSTPVNIPSVISDMERLHKILKPK